MEKLELKYLTYYLPYGLKISILTGDGDYCGSFILDSENIEGVLQYGRLPVMRPVSDLTKNIEGVGVPIIELLKNLSLIDLGNCDFEIGEDEGLYWVNAESERRTVVDSLTFDGNIVEMLNNGDDFSPLNPMITAYDFLDKNHFDWKFDLIKKGLAIDINTIKPTN